MRYFARFQISGPQRPLCFVGEDFIDFKPRRRDCVMTGQEKAEEVHKQMRSGGYCEKGRDR